MTLYYSLCFLLLAAEVVLSTVILGPWPHVLRRKIFTFLNENPVVAKVQYALKITFIFVALLFADAVQRLVRVSQEAQASKENAGAGAPDLRTAEAVHSRKFYAQRNLYLTGGTLGLALVLARAFSLALELVQATDDLGRLKASASKTSRTEGGSDALKARIAELELQLQAKDKDVQTIRSQAATQAAEFDRLGGAGAAGAGVGASKKLD